MFRSSAASGGPEATPTPAEPTAIPIPEDREGVIAAFVDAWNAQDWDRVDQLVFDATAAPGAQHRRTWEDLAVISARITAGAVELDGVRARVPLGVSVELDRLGVWEYETILGVVEVGRRWFVEWEPKIIHPGLVDGRRLEQRRVWPERGTIRAWDGAPLRTDRPVVNVGIEPRAIRDRAMLVTELAETLDIDPLGIDQALDAPGVQPDWFVPVAIVRAEDYPQVEPFLDGLDGVVTRREFDRRAPTDAYALQVLGTVGPITVEQLDAWGRALRCVAHRGAVGPRTGLRGRAGGYARR